MSKGYHIEAVWDAEAGVFYAKSNIPGLNVEAATLQDFIDIVQDVAPDLIEANSSGSRNERPRTVRLETELAFA